MNKSKILLFIVISFLTICLFGCKKPIKYTTLIDVYFNDSCEAINTKMKNKTITPEDICKGDFKICRIDYDLFVHSVTIEFDYNFNKTMKISEELIRLISIK